MQAAPLSFLTTLSFATLLLLPPSTDIQPLSGAPTSAAACRHPFCASSSTGTGSTKGTQGMYARSIHGQALSLACTCSACAEASSVDWPAG
eukprot:1139273-Pelagomonas_calceolata.AAC.3